MRQIALLEAEPLAAVSLITQRPGWLSDSKLEAGDDRGEIQAYLFRKLMRGELLIALECYKKRGFPGGASGKESVYKCRRHKRGEFDPWVGEIPCRKTWQPTPTPTLAWRISWTEEPGGLWSIAS